MITSETVYPKEVIYVFPWTMSNVTVYQTPTSPSEIEDTIRTEFEFSQFVSENPDLSFIKDLTGNDTSPTPVTVVEKLPFTEVTCEPEEDFPLEMTSADLFKPSSSESSVSEVSQHLEYESPERKSSMLSQRSPKTPDSSKEGSTSSDLSTQFQPSKEVLDYAAKLFQLRHQPPPVMRKPPKKKLRHSIEIDIYTVGLVAIQKALRENTILQDELRRDENSMDFLKREWAPDTTCPCDVPEHPEDWTDEIIDSVHDYSFLLDCRDLTIDSKYIFGANSTKTYVLFDVPMVDGHPWKKKAEQVMRFTDMEMGIGDQTAYDLFYYKQPCDRKIFLVLASHKVIGIVLAEKQLTAYRIEEDTTDYLKLEENPVPVRVGINRLWVHISMRRRHLATLLCDFVGRLFYKGERLKMEDYAFNCNFSDDGLAFARLYLKPLKVPLYKGKNGIKI